MNTLETLKATREFLTDPAKWHKGRISDERETCFCVMGAVWRTNPERMYDTTPATMETFRIITNIVQNRGFKFGRIDPHKAYVAQWNDDPETTHEEVLSVLDEAIALKASQE
jgi:hypothetical protein